MKRICEKVCRMVLCAALVCPAFVSCEIMELPDKVDNLIQRVQDLELSMNDQMETLSELVKKTKLTIVSVSVNDETGVTTIELSDGKLLKLLPKTDLKSFITYFTDPVSQEKCWAYIDSNGNTQAFRDDKGDYIPVDADVPEVVVEDDETWIIIGGVKYPFGGNSVFSDYEVIEDELTGEVCAVTFTFGKDMAFTVTVDGVGGFFFVDDEKNARINEYYFSLGSTKKVNFKASGVEDYIIQSPEGWKVKINEKDAYFEITAPDAAAVESGVAVGKGYVKVMSVLQGGKAAMTKLEVSSDPFTTFELQHGNLTLHKAAGVDRFIYGICEKSQFDKAAVFARAKELVTASELPAGYAASEYNIEMYSIEELTKTELTPGTEYTVWGVPVLMVSGSGSTAAYSVPEGSLVSKDVTHSLRKFFVSDVNAIDATLTMDLRGNTEYYFGLTKKEYFVLETILNNLNGELFPVKTSPLEYNGSLFRFSGQDASPSSEYVAWLAVNEPGKTFTEEDLIICEFLTLDLKADGKATVAVKSSEPGVNYVETVLTATDASSVYYAYLTVRDAQSYTDNDSRAKYLFKKGKAASASAEVVANSLDFLKGVKPETDIVMMAVAIDAEGQYGEVLVEEYKTEPLVYNTMGVNMEVIKNTPKELRIKVSSTGGEAEDYLYWIGPVKHNFWTSTSYLGAKKETAQEYMIIYSTDEEIVTTLEKYPVVDGIITMKDLTPDTEYVMVALAKDKDGNYSKASEMRFTPYKYDLGTVVTKDDSRWASLAPTIQWIAESFVPRGVEEFSSYAFNITLPKDYTAYLVCGNDEGFEKLDDINSLPLNERMLRLMDEANYLRDDIDNKVHYPHGNCDYGFVVIWGSEAFHNSQCDCGGDMEMSEGVYHDYTQKVFINDGSTFRIFCANAVGSTTEELDKVYVVYQDADGNTYEPHIINVPMNYFADADVSGGSGGFVNPEEPGDSGETE